MGPVSAEIAIDAPRERVFALLEDLSVRPSFTDHFIKRFHLLRTDPVGPGAGARCYAPAAGGWFDCVIQDHEAPHRIVERGHGGRFNRVPVITEWRLAELPGTSGCEVTVTFWTDPSHPFDRLQELRRSERKLAREWRKALQRLRALAEDEAPVERVQIAGASRI